MALYVRELFDEEWEDLEEMIQESENDVPTQRLMIVLLSAQGHRVQEISSEVDLHPINVRKWIHRFNADGIDGLRSGKSPGRPPVFNNKQRKRIVEIAKQDPRKLGRAFSQWSLQRLRKYLIETKVVKQISVETIRQILRANGVRHRSASGWSQEKSFRRVNHSSSKRSGRFAQSRKSHHVSSVH